MKNQPFLPFLHSSIRTNSFTIPMLNVSISTQEIQCLIICCYKLSHKHVYVLHNQQQYNQKHTALLQYTQSLHITNLYTPKFSTIVVFYNPFSNVLTAFALKTKRCRSAKGWVEEYTKMGLVVLDVQNFIAKCSYLVRISFHTTNMPMPHIPYPLHGVNVWCFEKQIGG